MCEGGKRCQLFLRKTAPKDMITMKSLLILMMDVMLLLTFQYRSVGRRDPCSRGDNRIWMRERPPPRY
ncbi:hypothetical protein AX760_02405 [Pararhizobium antarcticum]|uniref:Uncharacterized protein n=1 Tax=Pararhizobium antarcticum TaxID=1798805 RepID=A0A657LZ56_9HYPH|nr:hypothetical protein AX760_01405 [Pararhizobium antarcticum]OJF98888.1 hypothetical protein AX760_02405 [Pararhizobium antarcticum]OJF99145.1 hypothetical protein AX761_11835 [Rhizobium sp. 58]